jgi:hypothetical protein
LYLPKGLLHLLQQGWARLTRQAPVAVGRPGAPVPLSKPEGTL